VPTLLATPELSQALQRVAELEAEVRELRTTTTTGNGSHAAPPTLQSMRLIEVEALLVRRAMEQHAGNVSRAARQLGLSRSALYRRLDRHKI
jgi:two-component system NtrC family response regulator